MISTREWTDTSLQTKPPMMITINTTNDKVVPPNDYSGLNWDTVLSSVQSHRLISSDAFFNASFWFNRHWKLPVNERQVNNRYSRIGKHQLIKKIHLLSQHSRAVVKCSRTLPVSHNRLISINKKYQQIDDLRRRPLHKQSSFN